MRKYVDRQSEYIVEAQRITGSREEKLAHIDEIIQALLRIKQIECADQHGGDVTYLTSVRRSHWFAMTVTILVLFVSLALLLGGR
jgi:hypothetical protein